MISQTISHYRIIEKLGAGGMGEVYLAEDTKLDRKVAIKFLPQESIADEQAKKRLVREAKAAAALDHPNICAIYEVGEEVGGNFIVMQYVEGETLAGRIQKEPLELSQSLDLAVQVADALAEAHSHGIIHRDIKPQNIMITARGQAKVMDFGLAKVVQEKPSADSLAETESLLTAPGVIVGTVPYMSPEQVRGEHVEARSDIFSFGAVFYEMLSGRHPFQADSVGATMSSILTKDPAPLARYVSEVPDELQRIVSKTLTKDREQRYQTAKDLLIDLRNLKRKLEVDAEIDRTAPPEVRAAPSTSSRRSTSATASGSVAATAPASATHAASSAEYIVSGIKQHKLAAAIVVGLVALAFGGIGFGIYRLIGQKKTALSFQSAKFTRLTSTGKAKGAAISPDGKWLVHVIDDGGQQSLWLQQVAIANSNTQVVPPAAVDYNGVAFSPDGNYVYYTVQERNDPKGILYQVPVLGGTARKLLTGIDSSVAFSPDGKQIAFVHYYEDEDRLMIANADGTGGRQLAVRHGNEYFLSGGFCGLSWSPDGKTLASSVGNVAENYMSVVTVSVESGEIKFFSPQKWFRVIQVAWLADGSHVLVTALEQGSSQSSPFKIWQVSYPAGEAQRITNDLNSYPTISLTADSTVLATVQTETVANIWVMSAFDAAHATQITQGRNFDGEPSWTPDGKIVYSSNAGGSFDLYLIDSRGGTPKQLTASSSTNDESSVSPDGLYIVFSSDRTGAPHIWRMDVDGGNPKQLTDRSDSVPRCSPDSQWIIYVSWANKNTIWKVSINGGQPVQLTEKSSFRPAISPDGKQIVCLYLEEPNSPAKLAILPFEGGQPVKTFALGGEAGLAGGSRTNLRWSTDGRAIVYSVTRGGVSNLWAQAVDGGPPKQLTNFTSDRIFWFDFSRDGRQLALSRGTQTSDVVLISSFK